MTIHNTEALLNCFLFNGLNGDIIKALLSSVKIDIRDYERQDIIYAPESFDRRIGIVLSGECCVFRKRSCGKDIPLNTIGVSGCFGITAALSGRDDFPTIVIAKRKCTIAFIDGNDIKLLIEKSPKVSLNIIGFMSERICFLNDKIATFSGDNVEQKLARYLIQLSNLNEGRPINFNKKHASEAINAGRASLYRALDALTKAGLIIQQEKTITICDLQGLERISK